MRLLDQLASLTGAALILGAYLALQRDWLDRNDRVYNALNLAGAVFLTWSAARDGNVGFIILEGSWGLLSLPGTFRRRTAGEAA